MSGLNQPFLDCFTLHVANSENTDEMPHYVAFHLCLHCFLKYNFSVSSIKNGKSGSMNNKSYL